uniref:Phosphodiesterase n=1 Tax=Chromera velia CCMP2878 TaxID=1169474 RepID=A0A0G4HND4_9ALVE|eukprot:Cvel_29372.t1-p1 / transcript=Cvel_29372.t1 / gene=Cvel_29372 / organism=Chromera_velia_CCMP2878 / gene_product=Calcium/calmodulin-dependent 3',5'-cyclic, putative / transcript_product=Calcium/calmodulin-dependent 3',5'-cyclic, putative / location=Cvel_scaffold4003:8350-12003(-) / protein_length=716 / sequence_SO=supercontig / SO=protein_coding / is_pseudo=false
MKTQQKDEILALTNLLADSSDARIRAGDSKMEEVIRLLETSVESCQEIANRLQQRHKIESQRDKAELDDLGLQAGISAARVLRVLKTITRSGRNLFQVDVENLDGGAAASCGICTESSPDARLGSEFSKFVKTQFTNNLMRTQSAQQQQLQMLRALSPVNSTGSLCPCDCQRKTCELNAFVKKLPVWPLDSTAWDTDLHSLVCSTIEEHEREGGQMKGAGGNAGASEQRGGTIGWMREGLPFFLLPAMCVHLLSPYLNTLELEKQRGLKLLEAFGKEVERRYAPNPYHNALHAAEVGLSTLWFCEHTGILAELSCLQRLSLSIAALCHDVGHPGVTNQYLKAAAHPLAITYNDTSVLESFHAAETFRILSGVTELDSHKEQKEVAAAEKTADKEPDTKKDGHHRIGIESTGHTPASSSSSASNNSSHKATSVCNLGCHDWRGPLLGGLGPENAGALRKMIVELILATDMGQHFESVAKMKVRRQAPDFFPLSIPGDPEQQQERLTVWEDDVWHGALASLKMADLGHSGKPWRVHERYSMAVSEEFFQQGDREKNGGLPVSSLCDRTLLSTRAALGKSQTGFISFVCVPLMMELCEIESVIYERKMQEAEMQQENAVKKSGSVASRAPPEFHQKKGSQFFPSATYKGSFAPSAPRPSPSMTESVLQKEKEGGGRRGPRRRSSRLSSASLGSSTVTGRVLREMETNTEMWKKISESGS